MKEFPMSKYEIEEELYDRGYKLICAIEPRPTSSTPQISL